MSSEPQSCTKCGSLPEDILMLGCSHDLCLNCAAERLAVESKKKTATGITCQFCSEKTQLDAESIYELQKIMLDLQSRQNKRELREPAAKSPQPFDSKYSLRHRATDYPQPKPYSKQSIPKSPVIASSSFIEKRNCSQHPEQEIMYYCFECNCECICPECVIHGKHKNHDVKTLRKSQPTIKAKLEGMLEGIQSNVDGLGLKKGDFQKRIKDVTEANNNCKRQIQKTFAELKQKIASKQQEVLWKCDKALQMTIEEYEKGIKAITRKVSDIKQSTQSVVDILRRDELTLLNFYSRKNQGLAQLVKKIDLNTFARQDADKTLSNTQAIKEISHLIDQIGELDIEVSIKYEPRYDQARGPSRFAAEREYEAELEYQRPARDVDKGRAVMRQ